VIGIDPALKMLDQARRKPTIGNVIYWQEAAEALPLRDGCADLVFMSMVYHHFTGAIAVAHECHRVLRQGGYLCLRNGSRESDFPQKRDLVSSNFQMDLAMRSSTETCWLKARWALFNRE
jgi:ubiquinone/menaquinone biosynthesis C-methylase UbiE